MGRLPQGLEASIPSRPETTASAGSSSPRSTPRTRTCAGAKIVRLRDRPAAEEARQAVLPGRRAPQAAHALERPPQVLRHATPSTRSSSPPRREADLDDVPRPASRWRSRDGDHRAMLESGRGRKAVQGYLATICYCRRHDRPPARRASTEIGPPRRHHRRLLGRPRLAPRREEPLAEVRPLGRGHPRPLDLGRARRDQAEAAVCERTGGLHEPLPDPDRPLRHPHADARRGAESRRAPAIPTACRWISPPRRPTASQNHAVRSEGLALHPLRQRRRGTQQVKDRTSGRISPRVRSTPPRRRSSRQIPAHSRSEPISAAMKARATGADGKASTAEKGRAAGRARSDGFRHDAIRSRVVSRLFEKVAASLPKSRGQAHMIDTQCKMRSRPGRAEESRVLGRCGLAVRGVQKRYRRREDLPPIPCDHEGAEIPLVRLLRQIPIRPDESLCPGYGGRLRNIEPQARMTRSSSGWSTSRTATAGSRNSARVGPESAGNKGVCFSGSWLKVRGDLERSPGR